MDINVAANVRQYIIDFHIKHYGEPEYMKQRTYMLNQYRYFKENKTAYIEKVMTEGQIKDNLYKDFLGFECTDYTRCRTNGDIFDISGLAIFTDKELCSRHNIRFRAMDSITGEVKTVLDDGPNGLRESQHNNILSLNFIISLGGYHSNFYKDTGVPVVHPLELSEKAYQEELSFCHGLSTKREHEKIIDILTDIFHNDRLYYGDSKLGKQVRDMTFKILKGCYNPTSTRSVEMAILKIGLGRNPYNRMKPKGISKTEFYDRIAKEVTGIMNNRSPDPWMDFPFLHPVCHSVLYLDSKSSDFKVEDLGTLFEKITECEGDSSTITNNDLFKKDDKFIVFNEELVKRLGIKRKIVIRDNCFPLLKMLFGNAPFPSVLPSKNLYTEAANWSTDFQFQDNYVIHKGKKKGRMEARTAMGKIRQSKRHF